MTQARFVDVHVSYRTGGINPTLLRQNDACVIQAGVGNWFNPLLQEQIASCMTAGVPWATYHIPDPADGPIDKQVTTWASKPNVTRAPMISDIEHPEASNPRLVTATQAHEHISTINVYSDFSSIVYSRVSLLQQIFGAKLPGWWASYLWLAQYLYEIQDRKFIHYDPFLVRWADRLPPATDAPMFADPVLRGRVIAWQFTDTGDAREYIANEHTNDPVYTHGMTNCDLNVSTIDASVFRRILTESDVVIPPRPPTMHNKFEALVYGQNVRTGHTTSAPTITTLTAGNVYDWAGEMYVSRLDDTWVKLRLPDGRVGWAAVQYGRTLFLRSV